jgi:uncharacterized Tic20 family protein
MFIYGLVAALSMFIFIFPIVLLAQIILTIIASVQASKGNFYRYPLTIRILK